MNLGYLHPMGEVRQDKNFWTKYQVYNDVDSIRFPTKHGMRWYSLSSIIFLLYHGIHSFPFLCQGQSLSPLILSNNQKRAIVIYRLARDEIGLLIVSLTEKEPMTMENRSQQTMYIQVSSLREVHSKCNGFELQPVFYPTWQILEVSTYVARTRTQIRTRTRHF